jgi:hypothetical protein
MTKQMIIGQRLVWIVLCSLLAMGSQASLSGQLSDEIGRLIEAHGEVIIVTNDGTRINAVDILASAKENGVPIKLGNKIITSEYSSAVIQTLDANVHRLHEVASIEFGSAANLRGKKLSTFFDSFIAFFTRQSGKEGDYRTQLVNTGWVDIQTETDSTGEEG